MKPEKASNHISLLKKRLTLKNILKANSSHPYTLVNKFWKATDRHRIYLANSIADLLVGEAKFNLNPDERDTFKLSRLVYEERLHTLAYGLAVVGDFHCYHHVLSPARLVKLYPGARVLRKHEKVGRRRSGLLCRCSLEAGRDGLCEKEVQEGHLPR